jgi:hypothetical protein
VAPVLDGVVAVALWMRGADPTFLLCDELLPACEQCAYVVFPRPEEFVASGPQGTLCRPCFSRGSQLLRPLRLPVRGYGELVDRRAVVRQALDDARRLSLDDCFTFELDGLRLGEQVRASVLRFFGKADLSDEPEPLVAATARRYAAGALVAAAVAERALQVLEPDVVTAHHGVYVPQGVLGQVARREGVRVVNWGPSYRDRTFIFSHGDTYHMTFLSEPIATWDDRPLSETEERRLLDFLQARRRGEGDWAWVTPEAALRREEHERSEIVATLGLDLDRPVIGLLTNVLWDAQLYYDASAFGDMLEWLWATIDHFVAHPELQLLIRVHPHEVKHGNRQPVSPAIKQRYPALPENVHLVEHDSPLNTYALMDLCSAVLIYGTKTGVELTPFGTPVVVAADAWIRDKGLTIDISTRAEYARILDGLAALGPLDPETVMRARRYAHHFFFRRMIPIAAFEPGTQEPVLRLESLADLAPGHDPGLDVICDGILEGKEFVFDA